MRQHSGDLPPDEAIQPLDTLNLDYEPRRDVDPESRKRLKRVGWDHDAEFQPALVVYRPGRRPTIPNARELETLTALARAALPVLRKSEEDSDWLLHGPGEALIYHVRPGSASGLPEGERLPPPSPPEAEIHSAPVDQLAAARLERKTLRACGPWEIRVGTSGAAIQDPGGAYFPLAALFVDAATGFVAGKRAIGPPGAIRLGQSGKMIPGQVGAASAFRHLGY